MTRPPGYFPSLSQSCSIPSANTDGADTESSDGEGDLECQRVVTGDESRERETINGTCYMTISRLCEVVPFCAH
jgi:hypothetical protein